MLSHLRSRHPSITQTQPLNCSSTASVGQPISNEGTTKQSTMANFVTVQKRYSPGRAETITSLITKMVALYMMPVYTVEGKGFRQPMEFLEPEYKLPSHQTIMRRVNKMYGEIKRAVMDDLVDVKDVAITTDAWTSLANESYITVTIHYINKDWQRKSAVLGTSEMDESHSAENIAIRLDLVQTDWNLEGKIRACVRDNAFNQAATGKLLEDWEDLPCFAHALQLAVNAGFAIEEVKALIKKSGKLVGFFKKSALAATALETAQERYRVAKH